MTDSSTRLDIATFLVSSIHDMKNSVSVMTGHMEQALRQSPDTQGELYRQTTQALYEAQRVNDHLLQLLALYKIDRAFYPFDPRDHSIAEFAQDVMDRLASLAGFKGIGMECDCQADLWWWFDYDLVFGAITQAMHNALRYTRDRMLLRIHAVDGMLEIRVEDNGGGFPEQLLAADNTAFGRVSFESGSTRLGLYFSSIIARLHKNAGRCGETRLENGGHLGGGCFVLRLP